MLHRRTLYLCNAALHITHTVKRLLQTSVITRTAIAKRVAQ